MTRGPLNRKATTRHLKGRGRWVSEDALNILEEHITELLDQVAEQKSNRPRKRVSGQQMRRAIDDY